MSNITACTILSGQWGMKAFENRAGTVVNGRVLFCEFRPAAERNKDDALMLRRIFGFSVR